MWPASGSRTVRSGSRPLGLVRVEHPVAAADDDQQVELLQLLVREQRQLHPSGVEVPMYEEREQPALRGDPGRHGTRDELHRPAQSPLTEGHQEQGGQEHPILLPADPRRGEQGQPLYSVRAADCVVQREPAAEGDRGYREPVDAEAGQDVVEPARVVVRSELRAARCAQTWFADQVDRVDPEVVAPGGDVGVPVERRTAGAVQEDERGSVRGTAGDDEGRTFPGVEQALLARHRPVGEQLAVAGVDRCLALAGSEDHGP